MSEVFMVVGFALAAYSIVANDSIQTLGTFLGSNAKRPWWVLWLWISGIMVVTVLWGWHANTGDPAFGRLDQKSIAFPDSFNWLYVIPPLVLVVLTRFGIPVSTSLLVLTAFASLTALQVGGDAQYGGAGEVFLKMLRKSVAGYLLALMIGLAAYSLIINRLEKRFKDDEAGRENPHPAWIVFQWLSTGFLWSMWLVQDLANVFVYLPRRLDLWVIGLALVGMVVMQAFLIRGGGGKIQNVVTEKTNTIDIRSASFIDLFYGLILLFFKVDYIPKLVASFGLAIPWPEKMPMSTTWVFLGLLAGRELGVWIRNRHIESSRLRSELLGDLGKVSFGAAVSLVVAFGLPLIAFTSMGIPNEAKPPVKQAAEDSIPSLTKVSYVIRATEEAPQWQEVELEFTAEN